MATLAPTASAPAAGQADLWLHGRTYDLAWYLLLPLAVFAGLASASAAIGPKGPMAVYLASSMLTGLPHNMITWLLIMPRASRGYYAPGVILWPMVPTALVMAPTVLLHGTPDFGWALTLFTLVAYHHITAQHAGLTHSADARYAQATGDPAVRAETGDLRLAIWGWAASAMAWKAAGPPMLLGLGAMQYQFALQPAPVALPIALTGFTAAVLARWAWRTLARVRGGGRFPALQAAIAGGAAVNYTLAALVPNDQFFLTLAIVACFHNLQYFGFVYTHHHLRATADDATQDLYSRLARERRWGWWFAIPVLLGVSYTLAMGLLPPFWSTVLITFFMTSHYFVDGMIWRRKAYPRMAEFARGRVAPRP